MKEAEARKIFVDGTSFKLEKDKAYTLLELIDKSIYRNNKFYRAEGYLNAIEKAKPLADELNRLTDILSEEDQEAVFNVLHQWEKTK